MNINAGNLYRYAVKLIEGVEDVGTPQGLSSIIFATLSLETFINEIPFDKGKAPGTEESHPMPYTRTRSGRS